MIISEQKKEEAWLYYNHFLLWKEEDKVNQISKTDYCAKHVLDYHKFTNYIFRIYWKSINDPKMYENVMAIMQEKKSWRGTTEGFAIKHNLLKRTVMEATTHLNYLDLMEEIKREKSVIQKPQEELKFLQIPSVQNTIPKREIEFNESQPEVLEKQNDIEITISQGVKVCIAPNLNSMKIIKIIELLKDL